MLNLTCKAAAFVMITLHRNPGLRPLFYFAGNTLISAYVSKGAPSK